MQIINGTFKIVFRGIPLLFVSTSELTSEEGSVAVVYSIHLTPFLALGFIVKRKRKI